MSWAGRHGAGLEIRLLGPLEVAVDGEIVALPKSRKTRALLAYLAVNPRPQRRARLCELFWELPDDPRAALRWSLTKLREVLDRGGAVRVRADRDTAALDLDADEVDLLRVRRLLRDGVDEAATAVLEEAAALFRGPFLADLDLPQQPEAQSWIAALREEARRLETSVLSVLADRFAAQPERALPCVRALVTLDPLEEAHWARLIERLTAAGHRREAEEQYAAAVRVLAEVGGPTHVLERARLAPDAEPPTGPAEPMRQEIRFCHAPDGVRLAYALSGSGPPLVKAANWMNHLEYDWESPIWSHFFRGLSARHRLLRYDSRGNGLSDWDVEDISFEAWVRDLETVVDAAGFDRFPLLGVSQGCAISIAYATRHPERVSHLVLYSGFAAGSIIRDPSPENVARREAMTTLMRLGWGQANPAFRQMFTTLFIPDATREQSDAFNELQRRTADPEVAARHYNVSARIDVRSLLHKVTAPTLVLHSRGDMSVSIEYGRQLAAGIPGARFVPLPGQNHLFLKGEPSAERFFEELHRFLGE